MGEPAAQRLIRVEIVLAFAVMGVLLSCRRAAPPPPAPADAPAQTDSSVVRSEGSAPSASAPTASGASESAAPSSASVETPGLGAPSAAPAPTRPKAPLLVPDGPEPRDADAARESIIEQVRPMAESCYQTARGKQTGQHGRLRVILRFDRDMKVDRVDVTASGSVQRQVARCTQTRISKATFHTAKDTPRLLSFSVLLPIR